VPALDRNPDRAAARWLVLTVRRAGREARRRLARGRREEPFDPGGPLLSRVEGAPVDSSQRIYIEELLAALPEKERTTIVLGVFDGLTQKDIARRLRLTQSRVSQLRRAAMAHLRDLVEGREDDEGGG